MKNHLARTISLLFIAISVAGPLKAKELSGEEVIGSRSPNGKYAICFSTKGDEDSSVFHIRDLRSKLDVFRLSGLDGSDKSDASDSSRLLYKMVGWHSHGTAHKEQIDPAFSYNVDWNPNATLLCVEGGAHKFWHCCLYRKTKSGFSEVLFDKEPVEKLIACAKDPSLKIHNMGVNRFKKNYPSDEPYVHLLEDGCVAINIYPALINPSFDSLAEEEQNRIQVGYDLYFLWRLNSKGTMRFVGLCR